MEELSFKIVRMRGLRDEVIAARRFKGAVRLLRCPLEMRHGPRALGVKITRDVRQSRLGHEGRNSQVDCLRAIGPHKKELSPCAADCTSTASAAFGG